MVATQEDQRSPLETTGPPAGSLEPKVTGLDEAIRRYVRPGDSVYLDEHAQTAVRALARSLAGRGRISVIGTFLGRAIPELLASGVVDLVIAGTLLNRVNPPARVAVIQDDLGSGRVEYQPWSIYSLASRLMAGALGWSHVPTRCLENSSLARGSEAQAMISDPFGEADGAVTVSVLSPLRPDVAVVHARASDPMGRAIFEPPFTDGMWGARASKRGVIVLAERVVSPEELPLHAGRRMLPVGRILAVCPTPGAEFPYRHMYGRRLSEGDIAEEKAFLRAHADLTRDVARHRQWVTDSILSTTDEEGFRRAARNLCLDIEGQDECPPARGRGGRAPRPLERGGTSLADWDALSRIVLMGMRRIVARVHEADVRSILIGDGPGYAACGASRTLLGDRAGAVEYVVGTGAIDAVPTPRGRADMVAGSGWLAGVDEGYGVLMGGPGTSLAVLSAAQVDPAGNLNSNEVRTDGKRVVLAGSGGSNDAACLADHVIVLAPNRAGRFESDLGFVTAPGTNVDCIVTDVGVLERRQNEGRFVLVSRVQGTEDDLERMNRESSWRIEVGSNASYEPDVTDLEMGALRSWNLGSVRG